jgi:sec-independent protein translocase protein TatA
MFGLGLPEVIIIVLVVVVLFFGSGKIVELARSMGRVTGEFKKGRKEVENELKEVSAEEQKEVAENSQEK